MNSLIIIFFPFTIGVFIISLLGIFLLKKHLIVILMCIEMMLLSINLNLIFFSVYLDDIIGQIFALFVLTIAAAESAIGLAILIIYYRIKGLISVNFINSIKS